MGDAFVRQTLCNALAILDTNAHDPSTDDEITVGDYKECYYAVIKITNTLDQAINVQLYGNIGIAATEVADSALILPVTLGVPIFVGINDQQIRVISLADGSKPPVVYPLISALVLPTLGTVTIVSESYGLVPGFE